MGDPRTDTNGDAAVSPSGDDAGGPGSVTGGGADGGRRAMGEGGATADGDATCTSTDGVGPAGSYTPASYTVMCGTRDPFAWPFAKNSIWNMPIGSSATYVDAGLGKMGLCNVDNDLVVAEKASDPFNQVYRPDHKYGTDQMGATGKFIHIPDAFVYPGSPNNGASFFDVNGHTIKDFSAFHRDSPGSVPIGWDFGTNEVNAGGATGGHAGSGLSVVGGTLRPGELTSAAPIYHALKVEFDWTVLSGDWPGKFRWPAKNSDGYGTNSYGGGVKALTMGSLVALRPDLNLDSIEWKTPIGKKIAAAFQQFGAYVVDTTNSSGWMPNGGLTMAVCAQNEAIAEAKKAFNIDWASGWGGGGPAWTADMAEIYKRLAVIDNNSEESVGGGGTPKLPLAPDFEPGSVPAADAGP